MAAYQAAHAGPAAGLPAQQERARQALQAIQEAGWLRPPDDRVRARLAGLGHFPDFPGELAWLPCDVAGHLRDSALIFSARIQAARMIDRPYLVDFSTCDPARVARYRSLPRDQMLRELAAAQQRLAAAVAGVTQADMARTACHEFDGDVALADILAFLPRHQADHAEQLELLT
ncbi:MAG: DinB family protein [Nocardiopsaceae bacterium]|jgi:hypothetical protein|nr:DinB family protein [Nocardiopsaceae bacterium]